MKIRKLLLVTVFATMMTGAPALTTPAHACMGEICDAICNLYWTLGKPCPVR
jgi:hypothetical protein